MRLPELQEVLLDGARREERAKARRLGLRARVRGLRLPALAFGCVLAITTVALAAGGVILTGAPVRPEELLNPHVGEGIPAPGTWRVLPLRVPDPEGGLPWGMRVVRTTRGEVCVQVGRVQDGQLGELGIDGAFHGDGRFHPIPAQALPADAVDGHIFDAQIGLGNGNTTCHVDGEAAANEQLGLDRGAAPNAPDSGRPRRFLRDIAYGLLGDEAVSVRYRVGRAHLSEPVVPGIGAYLIVQRTTAHEKAGSGYGSLGTYGDLTPSPPLTAITYRIAGRLCERVPSEPPGAHAHLADLCSRPRFAKSTARILNLHRRVRAHLQLSGHRVTGVEVSFTAPYSVTSARDDYVIEISTTPCGPPVGESVKVTGWSQSVVGRDVEQGEVVRHHFVAAEVFECSRARSEARGRLRFSQFTRRSATIEVHYRSARSKWVTVGRVTVHVPAGVRPSFVSRDIRLSERPLHAR
jgi:hypothetical protein